MSSTYRTWNDKRDPPLIIQHWEVENLWLRSLDQHLFQLWFQWFQILWLSFAIANLLKLWMLKFISWWFHRTRGVHIRCLILYARAIHTCSMCRVFPLFLYWECRVQASTTLSHDIPNMISTLDLVQTSKSPIVFASCKKQGIVSNRWHSIGLDSPYDEKTLEGIYFHHSYPWIIRKLKDIKLWLDLIQHQICLNTNQTFHLE